MTATWLLQRIEEVLPSIATLDKNMGRYFSQHAQMILSGFRMRLRDEIEGREPHNVDKERLMELPIVRTKAFRKFLYPQIRQLIAPLGFQLRLCDRPTRQSLFLGWAELGKRPTLCLSQSMNVAQVFQDDATTFALKGIADLRRNLQHEWTHWLQYQKFPRPPGQGPRNPRAFRAFGQLMKPVGPQPTRADLPHDYRQWQNLTAEIEPVANELVRLLLDGHPIWQHPKLHYFLSLVKDHPFPKRLLKRITLILQSLQREDLLRTFHSELKQELPILRDAMRDAEDMAQHDRELARQQKRLGPGARRRAMRRQIRDLFGDDVDMGDFAL